VPTDVEPEAVTTPDELIVIPETEEASEVFAILQLHEEVEPVPPEMDGVELLALPKVDEISG
jgi:hypothetical protein